MYIINLDSVDGQTPGVGAKAASLGTLAKAGFLVPKGFVVTSEAFEKFLTDTGIGLLIPRMLEAVSLDEPASAASAYGQIRELFGKISGNDFLIRDLKGAYNELSFGKDVSAAGGAALDLIRAGRGDCFVSVRPSVVSGNPASFAGHGKAQLNLIGYRQLLAGIKDCWLSVFRPEALIYRKLHGIENFSLAVLVQRMSDSELSGTLFTSEPVSGGGNILAEGFWGLGETLSSGSVCPDQYLISRDGVQVSKRTGKKMWLRRRGPLSGNTIQEKVPSGRVSIDTIAERDLQKFAAIAARIEYVLKGPQHVEWAVERGRIVITQSSPVVFSKAQAAQSEPLVGEKIAAGIGVSAGIGKGKTISFPELSAIRKPAEPSVLVTKTLGMELLPYIKWFSGIVAEQGGAGSCLASIGRELGIPMVTGIENAGIILAGKEVVVDGGTGGVYGVTSVQS